jgi:hypothetical protein
MLNEGKRLPLLFRYCHVFWGFIRIQQVSSKTRWCHNLQNTIIHQYRTWKFIQCPNYVYTKTKNKFKSIFYHILYVLCKRWIKPTCPSVFMFHLRNILTDFGITIIFCILRIHTKSFPANLIYYEHWSILTPVLYNIKPNYILWNF